MSEPAVIRQEMERIPGVSRTWFEIELEADGEARRILVVEVEETDPNLVGRDLMDRIVEVAREALTSRTTMAVHGLRVVPTVTTRQ